MKRVLQVLAISMLGCTLAQARDIGPDEAAKLQASGTVMAAEALNKLAIAQHPGAQVTEAELDQEQGSYVYDVDLKDASNKHWDVKLNAATGAVISDKADD
jgi:uncharacterized membrane protein YkoI